MLSKIIKFSLTHKLIIFVFTAVIVGFGIYSLTNISIGAVPDVTNNQVQVITTSQNLSTQDMEQFITYPVELEMANLPGVKEIRSVSKFGLSVVTIVFEENLGTYLPRQLIAEKIKSASEKIPEGFGTPTMGPITTGLGEIYQYILDTKPGYENKYSARELRTIQDWIVKRQLSGIPGVVEINAWGGYLKEYEVAINTKKLNAMNIPVTTIFDALEKNNSVAGGGYIERSGQAYFIRGQGRVNSLDDIRNIVVKNDNGTPVYIKDVAEVGFGHAPRYGAITGNGEGEKVLGQVMMLKGANSNKVINAVKERVKEVSKNLPEGVMIRPFLDRSSLIAKTTNTIAENLILGCLIVIFVVVLLLGNFRSGLVVASVIPLCLLFALSLMYIFGIDANLMSLGAIDFGIIIDGAVIIVEYTAYQITRKQKEYGELSGRETKNLKDRATYSSASKMMSSAIFGQLIILIVFIPILSLSGVEGKMFRPMALTFSFALIGAMLFCLTYVPVMSSVFLKAKQPSPKNISVRIISFLNRRYERTIYWALKRKKFVIGVAAGLLALSVYVFTTMGGEFIPQLDEGDFVIQPVLKTGTSLSKTIETTTKIENILRDSFPEVEQVVSRIGAAEVPTDPMSMEETDVIVTLKPKSEWVSAESKDELAEKIKKALSVFPNMEIEFTQPIEMRFNELITGVRADIAIKVFGEDLDILNTKANQIKEKIKGVDGASDISVEKIVGLPQMNVKYDRDKIARYGLNIHDLNEIVTMGFSGKSMGSVFEGEKRFDLVLRLAKEKRQDISNLKNLYIDIPAGGKIPLSEVADITYQKSAAKISRDNTKRRIVVGVNVRNRDLESVVKDIQKIVDEDISLPPGYSITYGGQFENLQSATKRLKLAVPIALFLIFLLLYFAFDSMRQALMIFSAIPLAAVGGVLLLWLRDMPFSISAGVGFIALFGIAVLNGIVLIEHFKELREEGMPHSDELIVNGAKDRLRAVLLTASAAALGFLPMAISNSAGAEVQRPLATVVIGGLITSTLLTLVVLPVVYSMFHKDEEPKKIKRLNNNKNHRIKALATILLLLSIPGFSQNRPVNSFEELRELAFKNNNALKASSLGVDEARALEGTAFDFGKTAVYYQYDESNLSGNVPLKTFGVQQDFLFPTVYFARNKLQKKITKTQSSAFDLNSLQLEQALAAAYYRFQYEKAKSRVYEKIDSLYKNFAHAAERKFELGESNYLEKITARARQKQLETAFQQSEKDIRSTFDEIKSLVQTEKDFYLPGVPLDKLELRNISLENHPGLDFYQNQMEVRKSQAGLEKQHLLPDITLNYFEADNSAISDNLIGYQVGLKIPLFFNANSSRIKAAKISEKIAENTLTNYRVQLQSRYEMLLNDLQKYQQSLSYYEEEGNALAGEIEKTAVVSYKNGEIDFFEYIQSLENAFQIRLAYLDDLNKYNQTVIQINYLTL
ncbi:CusA/CzcA family heavy metal efflux RND transporter [Christiangramia fulva]|uniref:CusA/CzcA family heavy metal efflux RND transporter n=1 Tax=Christiangramia fulva TaxID=2126553 RepID=A0A2R3Z7L8_9FLAO|nr:CusA/CzcA family heavy metal efflux RND transporter [Christiangramia fulva]AVR46256.1 CusA/CzcA family heavy metal efflux RND transporter [Christiangramia fulva]